MSCHASLTRTIHEYLLRRPILSSGGAVLVRLPRRTASTPVSASLARSPGGLRSRTPRDGIHKQSGLDRPRITNDAYPTNGYSHTSAEASRVLRFRARAFRTTVLKRKMETLEEIRCTQTWHNNSNARARELHEELLERLLRFRGVSAVRYKTKPFEVMIRSP